MIRPNDSQMIIERTDDRSRFFFFDSFGYVQFTSSRSSLKKEEEFSYETSSRHFYFDDKYQF